MRCQRGRAHSRCYCGKNRIWTPLWRASSGARHPTAEREYPARSPCVQLCTDARSTQSEHAHRSHAAAWRPHAHYRSRAPLPCPQVIFYRSRKEYGGSIYNTSWAGLNDTLVLPEGRARLRSATRRALNFILFFCVTHSGCTVRRYPPFRPNRAAEPRRTADTESPHSCRPAPGLSVAKKITGGMRGFPGSVGGRRQKVRSTREDRVSYRPRDLAVPTYRARSRTGRRECRRWCRCSGGHPIRPRTSA